MEVINKNEKNYCAWTVSSYDNGLTETTTIGVSCRDGNPLDFEPSYFNGEAELEITNCILCNKKIKLVDEADYEDHCFMLNQEN